MTYDEDILIAGGGLNGLSMALALASAGFRVVKLWEQPANVQLQSTGLGGIAADAAVHAEKGLVVFGKRCIREIAITENAFCAGSGQCVENLGLISSADGGSSVLRQSHLIDTHDYYLTRGSSGSQPILQGAQPTLAALVGSKK